MSGTQAINRALALLGFFTDERPQWGVSELSTAANLNRTTTYRILNALEEADLLVRDGMTEQYRLGAGLIVLGGRAQRANRLRMVALPILRQLAQATGETASLEVLKGGEVLIVEEALGERLMSGSQTVGTRWPAHATSTGKAILAHLPTAEQEVWLARPLPAFTPHTRTTPAELLADFAHVRHNGVAIAHEELELGYTAVGAPIFDHEAAVVAAISLGGATIRLQPHLPTLTDHLRRAAQQLSHQLGFR